MYKRTIWKDHVVEHPDRFVETQNPDGSIEHVKSPGQTLQEGTNQDAVHFNQIEEAMQHMAIAYDMLLTVTQAQVRDLEKRLELAETKLATLAP